MAINIFELEENRVTVDQLAYPIVMLSEKTGQGKSWNMNEYLTSISPEGTKPLFLMFEDRYQLIPNIKAIRIRSVADLEMVKSQLKNPKAKQMYSCVVFDTADKYDAMLEKYIADTKEVEITGDIGFGKGNKYVKNKLYLIDELRNMGWKVNFLVQTTEVKDIINGTSSFIPKINKEMWAKISHDAYQIGMIKPDVKNKVGAKDNKWYVTFKASSQYPDLKDSIGLPDKIEIKELKTTIDKTLRAMGGVTFVEEDIINVQVVDEMTFEEIIARGQELGGKLAGVGKLEEALNVLRKNLGMSDDDSKTPVMFDSLVPSQIELAKVVVVQLEELGDKHKIK